METAPIKFYYTQPQTTNLKSCNLSFEGLIKLAHCPPDESTTRSLGTMLPEDSSLAEQPVSNFPPQGTSHASQEQPIDLLVLENFKAEIGDGGAEIMAELIVLFLEDSPARINQLQSCLTEHDADGLQHVAHTLKSGAAHVGAMRLSALCKELESLGRVNRLNDAAEKVAQLAAEYKRVEQALINMQQTQPVSAAC